MLDVEFDNFLNALEGKNQEVYNLLTENNEIEFYVEKLPKELRTKKQYVCNLSTKFNLSKKERENVFPLVKSAEDFRNALISQEEMSKLVNLLKYIHFTDADMNFSIVEFKRDTNADNKTISTDKSTEVVIRSLMRLIDKRKEDVENLLPSFEQFIETASKTVDELPRCLMLAIKTTGGNKKGDSIGVSIRSCFLAALD